MICLFFFPGIKLNQRHSGFIQSIHKRETFIMVVLVLHYWAKCFNMHIPVGLVLCASRENWSSIRMPVIWKCFVTLAVPKAKLPLQNMQMIIAVPWLYQQLLSFIGRYLICDKLNILQMLFPLYFKIPSLTVTKATHSFNKEFLEKYFMPHRELEHRNKNSMKGSSGNYRAWKL